VDRVLIVKTGTTVSSVVARRGDFEDWIGAGLGVAAEQLDVRRVFLGDALPDARDVNAVVVTGSAAMVTDRDAWSEQTAAWLRGAVELGTPVLGICYGHQLLAHAFGGTVQNNPHGRSIGTVDVALTERAAGDPLFAGMDGTLHVPVSHRQSVTTLPEGAQLLATNARDPFHAFAIGARAWGVQFHPEFDADIVRGYIEERRAALATEGLDPDALKTNARDSGHGTRVLQNFAAFVRDTR
jgi:GMP synthase (glutamine-hydrolysing)